MLNLKQYNTKLWVLLQWCSQKTFRGGQAVSLLIKLSYRRRIHIVFRVVIILTDFFIIYVYLSIFKMIVTFLFILNNTLKS